MNLKNIILVIVALTALTASYRMVVHSGPFNDAYQEPNQKIRGEWQRVETTTDSWAPVRVGARIAVTNGVVSIHTGSAAVHGAIVLNMAGDRKLDGVVTISESGYLVVEVQVPDPSDTAKINTVELVLTQLGRGGKVMISDGISSIMLQEPD
jgi:hypothetical protein